MSVIDSVVRVVRRFSRLGGCAALLSVIVGCSGDGVAGLLDGPGSTLLVRPDTPGNTLLYNFESTDVVETFDSTGGNFKVHFTRNGPNAVPANDSDQSGIPDFVEQVAEVYELVLTRYSTELGFRTPVSDENIVDNGGDGRFDVYLVDFAGVGDGNFQKDQCDISNPEICAGYMVQENDYAGYGYPSTLVANRILASHEFFHAVQAAYDTEQGSVMSEGSAVWATETYDSSLYDFEYFIDGYLENPDRSLDVAMTGPVDPFSYGVAIFYQFLEERFGTGTVRALWERCENGAQGVADPYWFEQLDPLLNGRASLSFAEAFVEFATYNLFTSSHADPSRSYANGAGYPAVDIETAAGPLVDDKLRVFYASAQYYGVPTDGRAAMTAALVPPLDEPEHLDDLHLLLAVDTGSAYGEIKQLSELNSASETVDTSSATRLVVVVVNGKQDGDSQRPALCVGSAEQVQQCRSSLGWSQGGGGAGAGGSSSGGSAAGGAVSGGGQPTTPPLADRSEQEDEGGCSTAAGATVSNGTPSRWIPWLLLLGAAAMWRRRLR